MHTLPLHMLSMLAYFISLWLPLGTDALRADPDPAYDTRRRDAARGARSGDVYSVADGDRPWQMVTTEVQNLRIPGLAPARQSGCMERLSVDTPRHGGSIEPTFRIAGSGCGLKSNEIALYMADADGRNARRVGSVWLTGEPWGESTFGAQLQTSLPPGSQVQLYAVSDTKTSNVVVVNVINPRPACAARRLEITSPQTFLPPSSTFEIRGSAGTNCTVTVNVTHSRFGYLGERAISADAAGTWDTLWTLQPGSAPGDIVFINAAIADSNLRDTEQVAVNAGPVNNGYRPLLRGLCTLSPKWSPLPTYAYPNGLQVNRLDYGTYFEPRAVVYLNGGYWFAISRNNGTPDEWVEGGGMQAGGSCYPYP